MKKRIYVLMVLMATSYSIELSSQSGSSDQFQIKFLDLDLGKKMKVIIPEVTIHHDEILVGFGSDNDWILGSLSRDELNKHVDAEHNLMIVFKKNSLSKSQKKNFKSGKHIGKIKLENEGWERLLTNVKVVSSKNNGPILSCIINYDLY